MQRRIMLSPTHGRELNLQQGERLKRSSLADGSDRSSKHARTEDSRLGIQGPIHAPHTTQDTLTTNVSNERTEAHADKPGHTHTSSAVPSTTNEDVETYVRGAVPATTRTPPELTACPAVLQRGQGTSFLFESNIMGSSVQLEVCLQTTDTYELHTARIIFVMHGLNRDVERYVREWKKAVGERSAVLVFPHFDRGQFPSIHEFHHGGMFEGGDMAMPREPQEWAYNVIERLYLHISARTGLPAPGYCIYGHSAGAQFVHRMVVLCADTAIHLLKAVSANAGRYLCPEFETEFPAGLLGLTSVNEDLVKKAFSKQLCVLLGENDTDMHKYLPSKDSWHGGKAQGAHRLARGQYFFNSAKRTAAEMGAEFNWAQVTVPGVGHSNRLMSPTAVRFFFDEL